MLGKDQQAELPSHANTGNDGIFIAEFRNDPNKNIKMGTGICLLFLLGKWDFCHKECDIVNKKIGVVNGLSKMLSLGKFTPSLGISALKNSVSESRISGNMTVSESRILKIWISESRILKIWISKSRQWDFNFLSASLSETRN